jgi:hypothetical protein
MATVTIQKDGLNQSNKFVTGRDKTVLKDRLQLILFKISAFIVVKDRVLKKG